MLNGEIVVDLISLFHVQIQEPTREVQLPQEHLYFLENFIITKYLK